MNIPTLARNITRGALDLLYPLRCIACGRFGAVLCDECGSRLAPPPASERCNNCSALWEGADNCPRCFWWDALDAAHTAFELDGAARTLVHTLKYRSVRAAAPVMAAAMRPLAASRGGSMFIPVPLHRSRKRMRGFNQAEELLRHLGVAAQPGLVRTRPTRQQVGLEAARRTSNIAGAFAWRGPDLTGARVTLIDDVITTGATANECARILKDYGAREVIALGFARASYDPDRPTITRDT